MKKGGGGIMFSREKRKNLLMHYFTKEIMGVFAAGIGPKNEYGILSQDERKISYEEAVEVLEHTISEIRKKPILF